MYKTLGGLIIFLFLQEEEKIGERKIRKISEVRVQFRYKKLLTEQIRCFLKNLRTVIVS